MLYTRSVICEVLKNSSEGLPRAKRAELQWDLWLVNGILEFNFPINDLLREREKNERKGILPETYELLRATN